MTIHDVGDVGVWTHPYRFGVLVGKHLLTGELTGTALELVKEWERTRERVAWFVFLDRLQECPEEAVGLDADVLSVGLEWYRVTYPL